MTLELTFNVVIVLLSLHQTRSLLRLRKEIADFRNQLSNRRETEQFKDSVTDLNARLDALQSMRFSYIGNSLRKERQR